MKKEGKKKLCVINLRIMLKVAKKKSRNYSEAVAR